jgi:hypothetical protein
LFDPHIGPFGHRQIPPAARACRRHHAQSDANVGTGGVDRIATHFHERNSGRGGLHPLY